MPDCLWVCKWIAQLNPPSLPRLKKKTGLHQFLCCRITWAESSVTCTVCRSCCCCVFGALEDLCQGLQSSCACAGLSLRQQTSACSVVLSDVALDFLNWHDLANKPAPSLFLYFCLPLLSPPSAIFLPTLLFRKKMILPLRSLHRKREWSKGAHRGGDGERATDCSYCLRVRLAAS